MVETVFDPIIAQLTGAQSSFVQLAGQSVWDMILFMIGIAIYAIFIWHFYKYVSRREVFKWETDKYQRSGLGGKFVHGFFYTLKFLVAYPILVFVWFAVFASLIFILSSLPDTTALIIAFAMVGAIRITAYYNEEISVDLGKMLPLAMLGVFILGFDFVQIDNLPDRLFNLGLFVDDILKFTAVAVVVEWFLRIVFSIKRAIKPQPESAGGTMKKKAHERFGR